MLELCLIHRMIIHSCISGHLYVYHWNWQFLSSRLNCSVHADKTVKIFVYNCACCWLCTGTKMCRLIHVELFSDSWMFGKNSFVVHTQLTKPR